MEKRLLIATVLSLAILLVFNKTITKKPVQQLPAQSVIENTQKETQSKIVPVATSKSEGYVKESTRADLMEKETIFETEKYKMVFSNVGASIKEIFVRTTGSEEVLSQAEFLDESMFELKGLNNHGAIDNNVYSAQKGSDYVLFTAQTQEGLAVQKKYTFEEEKNQVVLTLSVKNTTNGSMNLKYDITGPAEVKDIGTIRGRRFLGTTTALDDGGLVRKTKVKGEQRITEPVNYSAITNRYFAVIVKPFDKDKGVILTGDGKTGQKVVFTGFEAALAPAESVSNEFLMYFGPIVDTELKEYGYGFESVINYGIFSPISKLLIKLLRIFYSATHNWGIAILLLTLVVNLVSFPLTKKSFLSLNKMKTLQPHMEKLKKMHKDNPQKLNKEMMELYKKYNVNPFGGCLPMLLQIPIFIALYQGLIKAVELKGASFLWIKDLSLPEGLPIHMTLPLIGNTINILPLLMVVMMFLQQKIQGAQQPGATTDEQAQQQKMMMTIMPVFFGFLFYSMPSGLVLYWLTNTTLMTMEQIYLKKTAA